MESCHVLLAVSPLRKHSILKPLCSQSQIFTHSSSGLGGAVLRWHSLLTSKSSCGGHRFQTSNLALNKRCYPSFLEVSPRLNDLKVRAGAAPGGIADDSSAKPDELLKTLQLGAMFGVWYLLNIYFNIYNKQVLKVFPYPATVSAFQFGCGTVLVLLMWLFNLHPRPKITRSQFSAISLLALGHTVGNLLTNISLGKVAVSFTHTIKAMEPFFTVVLAALFLRERPSIRVVASLVPIVGGVALASFTEASFNWIGFGSAMASNLTNQSRNVYSKIVMVKEDTLDNINLFSVMTVFSFILLLPIAIFIDGIKLSPSYLQQAASQGLNVREFWVRSLLAGFCFHTYQQVSYKILQMVSPVTHSVGNSFKRVVVIVSSVVFFQTPVSTVNALGTGIALAGVFLYSQAKRLKQKPKPKHA